MYNRQSFFRLFYYIFYLFFCCLLLTQCHVGLCCLLDGQHRIACQGGAKGEKPNKKERAGKANAYRSKRPTPAPATTAAFVNSRGRSVDVEEVNESAGVGVKGEENRCKRETETLLPRSPFTCSAARCCATKALMEARVSASESGCSSVTFVMTNEVSIGGSKKK